MARAKVPKEKNDNYPTPNALASHIVSRLSEMYGDARQFDWLVEPSAGNGMFVRHIRAAWPQKTLVAVELRQEEEDNLRSAGSSYVAIKPFEEWALHNSPQNPALVIGNPPFTLAQLHLERMFQFFPEGSEIALLLRFSFFGGRERNETFWRNGGSQNLKHIIPIAPRPTFVRGTSDNSEYSVFIWKIGHSGPATILPHLIWEKNVRPRE